MPEVPEPIPIKKTVHLDRPDFNAPLTKLTPKVSQTLIDQVNKLQPNTRKVEETEYVFIIAVL